MAPFLFFSHNNQNVFCLFKMLLVSERCHAKYMVSCVLYSSAKKPWGSWSAFSGHVELCNDPLGACHKRSAFWTLVTDGSRHEGDGLICYWNLYQYRDNDVLGYLFWGFHYFFSFKWPFPCNSHSTFKKKF